MEVSQVPDLCGSNPLTVTVIHISEEMKQPGRRVPQVIMATMGLGLFTTIPLFLTLVYCMTSLDDVLSSSLPSLEIMLQRYVEPDEVR